jgi:hypothetical protein
MIYTDAEGNIWSEPVPVIAQHGTTALFWIGDGHLGVAAQVGDEFRAAEGTGGAFQGGSGRNWRLDSTASGVQGGYYRPTGPDAWASVRNPDWTWTRQGDGTFELHDGTDVVADSPAVGGLTGVASAGSFAVTDWVLITDAPTYRTWVGVGDPAASVYLDKTSGDALLGYGGLPDVAERLGGDPDDPSGVYTATAQGETDFNGGSPWTYTVTAGGTTGTATSTAYGTATYGGAFSFDIEFEGGSEFTRRPAMLRASGTTGAEQGFYTPTGWQSWESATDPAWTITLDGTGAGEWSDGSDVVATRAADAAMLYDPSGRWESTAYGAATYGDLGADFEAEVGKARAVPLEGYWWGELTLDSGTNEVTGTAGPFFGASWPANSPTRAVFPLAHSDGAGVVKRIQTGPIHWRP